MTPLSSRHPRDCVAFLFRRIPLPDRPIKDAWWFAIPRTCDATAGVQRRTATTSNKRARSHDWSFSLLPQ